MSQISTFAKQKYLNLETYRKNGVAMSTPVWFVQDGNILYVRTIANSGKVKRIRNNPAVKIAPCTVNGTLLADWRQASAREVNDLEMHRKVDHLLGKKYGLMKMMFALSSALKKQKSTILEIKEKS